MHISEGFLPPFWAVFWFLASAPFVYLGVRKAGELFQKHPEQKLMLAVSGAFIFVLSALKLPSVAGSSSHPTGTGLSTMLFGFTITSLLATIVLVFQAILLAHGGLTTLGADVFSMGVVGPAVAAFVFLFMRKLKINLGACAFASAMLADWTTYLVTSLQLALAYPSGSSPVPFTFDASYITNSIYAITSNIGGAVQSFWLFAGIFAFTQIPLAIAEGIVIWMFFDYLAKTRPKLIASLIGEEKGGKK